MSLKDRKPDNLQLAFTLIEMLVVFSIMALTTGLAIKNLASKRANLNREAQMIIADIRNAQSMAIASRTVQGPSDTSPASRCGFGIHQDTSPDSLGNTTRGYMIYAGANAAVDNCNSRQYNASQDFPVLKSGVLDPNIEFDSPPIFDDVYFEPPYGKTYINNSDQPGKKAKIPIKKNGVNCPSHDISDNCLYVCVLQEGSEFITNDPDQCS